MCEDFLDWFVDFLGSLREGVYIAAKILFVGCIVVITCPLWILPFAYWYFFERRADNADR